MISLFIMIAWCGIWWFVALGAIAPHSEKLSKVLPRGSKALGGPMPCTKQASTKPKAFNLDQASAMQASARQSLALGLAISAYGQCYHCVM